MTRCHVRTVSEAAALLSLVLVITVSAAAATPTGQRGGCPPRGSIKTLFPTAKAVGFNERVPITFQKPRQPVWPGRCAGWWAEYRLIGPPGFAESYLDVSVTVYRTSGQALFALREPAYASTRVLSDGARARFAKDGSGIASVIRNVFISTQSSSLRTETKSGSLEFPVGPDFGIPVQLKIHRSIHANVLHRR